MTHEHVVAPGLHVEHHGPHDGPLVVLVHGSMDRASSFLKVQRRLPHHLRVERYDRRGYAHSLGVGPPFSLATQVRDLVAVLQGRRAVVVGHSFGGTIALAAAERHPELIAAVVVFEPPLSWLSWWPKDSAGGAAIESGDPEAAAEAFVRRLIGDRAWDLLPGGTQRERREEGAALLGELADLRNGPGVDLATITVPVVVGRGELARQQHVWGCDEIADRTGSSVVIVAGATHGAHRSHPDDFVALIQRGLDLAGPPWAVKGSVEGAV